MKKVFSVLLAMLMLMNLSALFVFAEEGIAVASNDGENASLLLDTAETNAADGTDITDDSISTVISAATGGEADYSALRGTTLNVYNWGEYISDGSEGSLDVNAEFENRYGITVNYTTYDTNESLYNKLVGGGANYDVIIPSDYMIERLKDEGLLLELDFNNIPNYQYILDEYKGLDFDPEEKYSVPYTVGMVGLIYNKTIVEEPVTSWSIMWDEKYSGNILMFNNPRDAFAIAQFRLGQNLNTEDKADWDAAAQLLKEQKPLVASYVMDEIFNKMEAGDAAIAPYYAGDYLTMADVNADLAFVYPEEGTNYFVDSMCVPSCAQNKAAAELYINFMLEEDIGVANADMICYASPNGLVLNSDDYELKGNSILYPLESEKPVTQYFMNLNAETLTHMTELWNELKIEGNNNNLAYIGLGAAALAVVAVIAISSAKKKKREAE